MTTRICIFEDHSVIRLSPVNYLRHTSDILCGALSLRQKIKNQIGVKFKVTLHSRKYLSPWLKELYPQYRINSLDKNQYIFLNSRIIFGEKNLRKVIKFFRKNNNSAIITPDKNIIVAFHTTNEKTLKMNEIISNEEENLISIGDIEWLGLNVINLSFDYPIKIIDNPSDLINNHNEELINDLKTLLISKSKIKNHSTGSTSKKSELDATAGSIFIGKNTIIEPFCYIKGPVFIGDNCVIRSGSCIYGPVSIGSISRVSGEITSSIIHSFVNKQHLGFLGHSYICEWVNLGAGTTTSNLKNNYSEISVNIGGVEINTGSIFLGSIIGDHTKTGISTMLNTGTFVGISSNLYGSGYHKKIIKSFSWSDVSSDSEKTYILEKALSTAKISMLRRGIQMSVNYENMLRHIYNEKENLPL